MGAYAFRTRAQGATAEEAFRAAVDQARYESGHGGYTGTLAEKASDGFVMKRPRPGETVDQLVERTLDDNQKWGPAFCVLLEEGFREVEERHAQPVSRERLQRHPHTGARRWQTVYVLYQDEEVVPETAWSRRPPRAGTARSPPRSWPVRRPSGSRPPWPRRARWRTPSGSRGPSPGAPAGPSGWNWRGTWWAPARSSAP